MANGKRDAGISSGSASGRYAGSRDAGSSADSGTHDAGGGADAGARGDAGSPDAGTVIKRSLQLTFDDGPEPVKSALDPILKELKALGVKAAFFVIGEEVMTSRSAVVAIRDAGHFVGNHSWDHMEPQTSNYSDDQIYKEFEDTHAEVKKAGITMEYWRAPRGEEEHRVEKILTTSQNFRKKQLYSKGHCYWQADSDDWRKGVTTAEAMLAAIGRDFKRIAPLRIDGARVWRLLFHVKPTTASALPDILKELQDRGGTFVDFSQDS